MKIVNHCIDASEPAMLRTLHGVYSVSVFCQSVGFYLNKLQVLQNLQILNNTEPAMVCTVSAYCQSVSWSVSLGKGGGCRLE